MNPNLFESGEFYTRRYGSFSVYLILPMSLLLVFLLVYALFNQKEITVQSIGELLPTHRIAQIQSTSDQQIIANQMINHQVVKKGQILVSYSGTVTDTELSGLVTQLGQIDQQIVALKTLRTGVETRAPTFTTVDAFGYQSTLAHYLSQLDMTQKEHAKTNADIASQNSTVYQTQTAIQAEIDAIAQKIKTKQTHNASEEDQERRTLGEQELEQLEANLSSLRTQAASAGVYQTLDTNLAAKLDNLQTAQLSSIDKELLALKDQQADLSQKLTLAKAAQQHHQITAPETGVISLVAAHQNKKMIPTGAIIAEILPELIKENKLTISYYVDSSGLTALKKGQAIRFTSTKKLREQLVLSGKVTEIAKSATPMKGQNFFQVKATVFPSLVDRKKLTYGLQGKVSSIIDKKTFFQYYKDKLFGEF